MPPKYKIKKAKIMEEVAKTVPENSKSKYSRGSTYRRNRHDTKFDTIDMASELKHKISVYIMNEKYVPKRWRYFNGKPAVDYARQIRDLVSRANDIQLSGEQWEERAELQDKALSFCNILQLQLIDIIAECDGATDENMREITDILSRLIGKIKNWSKSDSIRAGRT